MTELEEAIVKLDLQEITRVVTAEDVGKFAVNVEDAKKLLEKLQRLRLDYGLFEELAPPDVPRAEFVKWCFDAWEEKSELEPLREENKKLKQEMIDWCEEAFLNIAFRIDKPGETHHGWYETCCMTSAVMAGDRLVELGLYERHPEGFGRRWFYRPITAKADKASEQRTRRASRSNQTFSVEES